MRTGDWQGRGEQFQPAERATTAAGAATAVRTWYVPWVRLGDTGTEAHAADFVQFGAQAMTQRALRTKLVEQVLGLNERIPRDVALKQLPPAPRHFLFGEQDRAFRQEDRWPSQSLRRPADEVDAGPTCILLTLFYRRTSKSARQAAHDRLRPPPISGGYFRRIRYRVLAQSVSRVVHSSRSRRP